MTREDAVEILTTSRNLYPEKSVIKDAFTLALSALQPSNEPLTLAELREMDGEPVWCCAKGQPTNGAWMLVGANGCENLTSFAVFDDYGIEWLAYRRPPEG